MLLHQITAVLSRSGWRPEKPESPSKASVRHLLFQAFPFRSAFLSPFVTASGLCWLWPCFPTLAPFIAFPSCPPKLWFLSAGTLMALSQGMPVGAVLDAVLQLSAWDVLQRHVLSIQTGTFLGDRNENLLPPMSVFSRIYFIF